tara:strand:- start:49 stop:855 length:807 start_codon:yes stop_codon:yes gene_type:complete
MKQFKLPLQGRNIVITRSKDQISEAKKIFQNAGAFIFDLPALIIDYPDDVTPLDKVLDQINKFDWIIFLSSNGIKYLNKRLLDKGLSLVQCSNEFKIAVVGKKTAQYLSKTGIVADYIPPDFMAESLVKHFPFPLKDLNILIPRVQSGGNNLIIENFLSRGALVKEVAAYESRCPEEIPLETINALQSKMIDAILFSSGKTVKNTAFLMQKHFGREWESILSEVKLFSIGPQTTLECHENFGRVDKEADIYTFEGLLKAAINYFSQDY